MEKLEKFKSLGLSENTLKALSRKGFEEPSPIQEKTIPYLLSGEKNVIGQAQTGTGKTAAFGIPLVEKLNRKPGSVQALILTPTRELAVQVSEEINSLRGYKKLKIMPIYGGASIEAQIRELKKGIDIIVGTPGRVIDHINRGTLDLSKISFFILDEADEMLNMGFIEDVEKILSKTNNEKRMLMFSATMPSKIKVLAKKYMGEFDIISVKEEQLTTDLAEQIYFEVRKSDKFEALSRIIDVEENFYGLVFTRTKVDAEEVANRLIDRGYSAEALHGDISQYQRERILKKFKTKNSNILVATDVAARGIDIENLTHVINYSLPQNPESYVHRIGRTGRAGNEGTAITFVTPEEYRKLLFIKRFAKAEIKKSTIPEIKDVINTKKQKIKEDIKSTLSDNINNVYEVLAKDLIEEFKEPEKIIAAVLKNVYQDELETNNYNEIKEVSIDKKGKTRLFVALGRADEMNPKKLVDYIEKETKVPGRIIRDVRVFEKFSFITVPFEDAEIITAIFKKKSKGRKPLIERAKEKKDNNDRNDNRNNDRRSNGRNSSRNYDNNNRRNNYNKKNNSSDRPKRNYNKSANN
ncbi:ATP-dependent RNA helicase DeaD [Oceanotoga teriensis]|uniref:ATP-dependent RNA helicase DeaD n=1 Tax=Oceanotoga teriensis TaxID=515440 RepID=A0AA45HI40_9BACT|nr:DEAD/DEAH box helicase [Oceanotoga teriensis]PWJ89315.1 ATP-dependent RNA helicase DeaD [Oceanotoga teriensis]